MLDGKDGNVALFMEQQHESDESLAERVFETYLRLRDRWRLRTTCIVIYTGGSKNVNTYNESCYGFEVSVKFRIYCLPGKSVDELRADKHPFALVMLAGRLSRDAGDRPSRREKYAMEILETTNERGYDKEKKLFILDFSRRIFRLGDPKISEKLKEAYETQTIPLRQNRK